MFGSNRGEPSSDLAARLSMTADGYTDNSAFDALCHEAEGSLQSQSSSAPEFQGALSALGNFDEGLTVYDAVAQSNNIESSLLDPLSRAVQDAGGTPWPTPYETPDFMSATTESIASKDIDSLAGLSATSVPSARTRDFKTVVTAASLAGTALAGKTAQGLLRKSVQIAALADDRAKAAAQARAGFQRTLREVDQLDARAKLLAKQLVDENGEPRKDITLADVERLKKLRARSLSLGRRAVRYQKVNALATPLTQNAIAQADIAQKMAASVLAGNVGATAALGKMFDDIGRKSAEVRSIRDAQLQKWTDKSGMQGFESFVSFGDPYEAGINALERADLAAFAGLEFSLRKIAKSVGKGVTKVVKKATVDPVKTAVSITRKTAKGDIKGAFKEVGTSVRTAAKDIAQVAGKTLLDYPCRIASSAVGKAAIQAAGQAVGSAYGGPVGGALGSEAGRQAGATNQSICGGIRKIGITDGTFRPGQVKSAFTQVAKDVYKTSLSPQAALLAAKNVGMSYASGGLPGGAAGGLLSKFSGGGGGNLLSQGGSMLLSKVGGGSGGNLLSQGGSMLLSKVGGGSGSALLSKLGSDTLTKLGTSNIQNLVGRKVGQVALQQGQRFARQQAQRVIAQQTRRVLPSVSSVTERIPTGRIGDYL